MVKFSLFSVLECPEGRPEADVYGELLDLFTYAEELGFHGVWVAEHHFSDYGTLGGPPVFLSALAARTETLKLGAAISVLPFHDPIRIAEDFAVVDVISKGRLQFGTGRGYQPKEFQGFGIDMAEARGRFLEELEIIERAWSGEEFSFDGEFYKIDNIKTRPQPVQDKVPTYVASVSPETFDLVQKWGHGVMASLLTNSIGQVVGGLSAFRESLPEDRRWSQPVPVMMPMYVGDTMEQAFDEVLPYCQWYWDTVGKLLPQKGDKVDESYSYWKMLGERTDTSTEALHKTIARWPIGDADHVVDFVTRLCRESTADEVIAFATIGAMEYGQAKRNLERIAQEVMPRVNAALAEDSPLQKAG
jgi:alkanesulfonate monooxygenase SsuD/methylene tetrahydromethanopterin reductase-like flavin-dependent oxidoreductase (luciferase family)